MPHHSCLPLCANPRSDVSGLLTLSVRGVCHAVFIFATLWLASSARAELRAGAAKVDITPPKFPVIVNGGVMSRTVEEASTKIHARAIVLDDGQRRLGIVVADSCMMPRQLLDEAKQLAAQQTQIQPQDILISATHAHSAPSSMGALGTPPDEAYVPFLRLKLAEALRIAEAHLEPAEVGWSSVDAPQFTALRRWVRRPDRVDLDPFGNPTVRANMHAGRDWSLVTGESGPEDPELSLISLRAHDGRAIAVLANYSMHYFGGVKGLGADYFGQFADGLEQQLTKEATPDQAAQPPMVGIMSHGCSGDIWRRDYTVPNDERVDPTMEAYTEGLLKVATEALRDTKYQRDVSLAMAEQRMNLKYRVPDQQRLEWAKKVAATVEGLPKSREEVYALEQIILHERQQTEVVVQALRIGDIGIATTPNETYALTGLKIKRQSPLEKTMVIELANGGDGYIPPPEQHVLGGYNTWAARSAGLEVQAEPKIAEAAISLLEETAGKIRRSAALSQGPAVAALLKQQPLAYWRLDEMQGPRARDISGKHRDGIFEDGVVFFLEGAASDRFCQNEPNRCAHFAGGRLRTRVSELGDRYQISLWIWNGMPADARDVAGWFYSRDRDLGLTAAGEHVGLGGAASKPGALVLQLGKGEPVVGNSVVPRWTWAHVQIQRSGQNVRVLLNGKLEIEATSATAPDVGHLEQLFFGGRSDNQANWEGRLDEIVVLPLK